MKFSFTIAAYSALALFTQSQLFAQSQCPTAIVSGAKTICAGGTSKLSAASSKPGSGNITSFKWIWNGSEIAGANDSTLTITQDGEYKVIVTNSNNCSSPSRAYEVILNHLPIINIKGEKSFCGNGKAFLDSRVLSAMGKNMKYEWKLNGNVLTNDTLSYLYAVNPGSYTLKISGSNGCFGTSSPFVVTQNPSGTVNITGASSLCSGNSTPLQGNLNLASGVSVTSYQWYLDNAIISGATANTYQATKGGKYKLMAKLSNACSISSAEFVINSNSSPNVSIIGEPKYCMRSSTEIAAQIQSGGTAPFNYQWFLNSAPIAGATTSKLTYNTPGSYHVEVTDANGCLSSTTPLNGEECSVPTILISGSNKLCVNDYNTLTATVPSRYDISKPYLYIWRFNGNEAFDNNPEIQAYEPGTYQVEVLFECGCSSTSNPFVLTNLKPTAAITGNISFCNSQGSTTLYGTTSTAVNGETIVQYEWKYNGAILQGANTDTLQVSNEGIYQLIITDSKGCKAFSPEVIVKKDPC